MEDGKKECEQGADEPKQPSVEQFPPEWRTILGLDNRLDPETVRILADRFGPFFQARMGMEIPERGYSKRFTGRGGQVHKVSPDGKVLEELVSPPPPTIRQRIANVLSSRTDSLLEAIMCEAKDFLKANRHVLGNKLIQVGLRMIADEKPLMDGDDPGAPWKTPRFGTHLSSEAPPKKVQLSAEFDS